MNLLPQHPSPSLILIALLLALPMTTTASGDALEADEVARKVAEAAGNPYGVEKLAFTFVVRKNGERVMTRRHIWQPGNHRLKVESGDETVRIRHIDDYDLTSLAKEPKRQADVWNKIARDVSPKNAARAWKQFINDSYWLLAPSKVTDPGVETRLDDSGRLVLSFDGVGLTPGDTYKLTVDAQTWRVTRWSYELQSGRTGDFDWLDYQRFGPLELSTRRVSRNGDVEISFEDVVVEP